jgi:hypothetical protein
MPWRVRLMPLLNRFELKDDYKFLYNKYRHYNLINNFEGLEYASQHGIYLKDLYITPLENQLVIPLFFEDDYVSKNYKGAIFCNRKLVKHFQEIMPGRVFYTQYAFLNDFYYQLDKFLPFEKKIKGISCLNKVYHTGNPGDIIYLREDIMNALPLDIKHVYSNEPWLNLNSSVRFMRKGTDPYSCSSLEIRNQYLFCLCLETQYHEYWSFDWLTERMLNCFKSKTLPVYLGCWNIEEYVPERFFIDLRKYIISETPKITFDYHRLGEDLLSIMSNKTEYENIVNEAYEWQKTNTFGNFEAYDKRLEQLVGYHGDLF